MPPSHRSHDTQPGEGAPSGRAGSAPALTAFTRYADAQRHFSREALWALFDGDRERLNIGHECLDRHPPHRTAVRVARAEGADEAWTFGELSAGSARFAHWLAAAGVGPGERVAIMLEPSLPFYVALFGAMKAGAVAVPLFTLFGPEGLRLRLEDCRPRLLLTSEALAPRAGHAAGARVVVADNAFLAALEDRPEACTPTTAADAMAMYQYTSGTTRELPEAVRHAHRAIVTVMIAALYGTGIRPGDRFCCPSSPAWGHGLWHGTLAPLALGVTITAWAGPFDPARLLEVLEGHGITNLSAAATHYRMLKNCGRAHHHRYALEKLSFTGEPMDRDTADFVARALGRPARSMYGTTEVGVILAGYPGADDLSPPPGSLGRPVPGVEVAVLDAAGRPCPPGVTGELVVWRRGGWVPTRDRAHTDAEGFYYHDGRADDVIISAGWTMSATEIEDVLHQHADVREAAVAPVPDETRGQVPKAWIVSDRPGSDAFAAELQDWVRERLSAHEYPRQVAFAPALPRTPAGKVNRKALRETGAATPQAGAGADDESETGAR